MDQSLRAIQAFVGAIIGLAIFSVLLSRQANTVGVIGAGGRAFSSILAAATAPVTGQGAVSGGVAYGGGYATGAAGTGVALAGAAAGGLLAGLLRGGGSGGYGLGGSSYASGSYGGGGLIDSGTF
jgi:hypothetical protein